VFVACLEDDAKKSEEQDYPETQAWWTEEIFYQVFVRSFYDSDGDGNGDLKGASTNSTIKAKREGKWK